MHPFIATAYAQAAQGAADNAGGGLASLLQFAPIVLVLLVFYFIYFRPQQMKAKEAKSMLSAIRRGDRVVTAGGIIGTVNRVKEGSDELEVEIAPNVRVTVLRHTLTMSRSGAETVPAKAS